MGNKTSIPSDQPHEFKDEYRRIYINKRPFVNRVGSLNNRILDQNVNCCAHEQKTANDNNMRRLLSGTQTSQDTQYQRSSTCRRKMYADSLQNSKQGQSKVACRNSSNTNNPKEFKELKLPRLNREYNLGISNRDLYRLGNASDIYTAECLKVQQNHSNYQGLPLVTQSRRRRKFDSDLLSFTNKNEKPGQLPCLSSLRLMLDNFEIEIVTSTLKLQESSEELMDINLLVGRQPAEQNVLLSKTKEGSLAVQSLLSQMHNHISQAHQFCNMLHRMDESLKIFSKAICTINNLEQRQNFDK